MRRTIHNPLEDSATIPDHQQEFVADLQSMIKKIADLEAAKEAIDSLEKFVEMSDEGALFGAEAGEATYEELSSLDLTDADTDVSVTVKFPIRDFDEVMQLMGAVVKHHHDEVPDIVRIYNRMRSGMVGNITRVLSPEARAQMENVMRLLDIELPGWESTEE